LIDVRDVRADADTGEHRRPEHGVETLIRRHERAVADEVAAKADGLARRLRCGRTRGRRTRLRLLIALNRLRQRWRGERGQTCREDNRVAKWKHTMTRSRSREF